MLPPGTYDVSFSLARFATLHRPRVKVRVGGAEEVNVALGLATAAEEITVTGEGSSIVTQSNRVGANYDADWVRNAPLQRFTFFDLINAAPGVNQSTSTSSRSTSLGSNTTENAYLLDGTDFTAPLTGAAWPWTNPDAIGELEVITLGAPAEYGNLQGAVFNVVGRQGSNAFHGDVNYYFQHQRLTGRNTTDEEDGGRPYHRARFHDVTLQVGGPILKDKLWFFASGQYQRDAATRAGADPAYPGGLEEDRVFVKLNWQIDARNKLMLAYHDDYYRISDTGAANVAPSAMWVDNGHNPSPNLTFTSTLSDKTILETRLSGFYGRDQIDPLDGGPRVSPRFLGLDTGQTTGGISSFWDADVWKTAASAKLSHFADDFLGGDHDFKFGIQYSGGGADWVVDYNDYIYTYGEGAERYGYGLTRIPYNYGGEMKAIGFYADDSFRAGSRLTVNAGIRYDHSRALFPAYAILDAAANETGRRSPANDDLFTWDNVSPRIGFNLKLTSDGRTLLRSHYGRYYRGIVTQEFSGVCPSISPTYAGTWDFAAEGFVPNSLQLVRDNSSRSVDPGFRSSYTDQLVAGFERELFKGLVLGVDFTHKRGEDYGGWREIGGQYEDAVYVDELTGRPIRVKRLVGDPGERRFLLTNPEGLFSRFSGAVFHLTKRMAGHWQLTASWVPGKSKGRIGSSRRGPLQDQAGTAGDFGQNPNDFVNTDGGLIEDRPTTVKAQLVVQLPHGFLVSANYLYQSGRAWAR